MARLFHLNDDDSCTVRNLAEILQPVQDATLALTLSKSRVGDVLPLISSHLDSAKSMDIGSDAKYLQRYLVLLLRV